MKHNTQSFILIGAGGISETFQSRPYTFEIEETLIDRFGAEVLKDFAVNSQLEAELTLDNCKEDMPKLLVNLPTDLDYKKQKLESFVEVYTFFLLYKKHAITRQLKSESETVLSVLQTVQKTMNLIPLNTSMPESLESLKNSLQQTDDQK